MKILIVTTLISILLTGCGGSDRSGGSSNVSTQSSSDSRVVVIQKSDIDTSEDGVVHMATAVPTQPVSTDGWFLTFEDNFDDAATAISKGADPN
jgi:hypothetical protein